MKGDKFDTDKANFLLSWGIQKMKSIVNRQI